MKKFKAIVNHTGSCAGEHFKRGKEEILSENVIKALGKDVEILEEVKDKEEEKEEKPEAKELKSAFNKMIGREDVKTK